MATGASANLKWGMESTFGTEATNVDFSFGYGVEITSFDFDNDPNPRRGLGSRNLQAMAYGMFKGSISLKFDLVEPWIFRMLTGEYASSGAGPYEHVFSEADILPSFTIYNFIDNIDGGADTLRKLLGCVILDWSLDVSVSNEPIGVTLNIAFANVSDTTTTETPEIPTDSPMLFANAVWKKDAVAVAMTENVSIKCNQNTEPKAYLGARFASRAKFGIREYDVSSLHYYQLPVTYFNELYGAAGAPVTQGATPDPYTLEITPTGDQTGGTFEFAFTDAYAVKISNPQQVGEDIMEEVSLQCKSLELTVDHVEDAPTW